MGQQRDASPAVINAVKRLQTVACSFCNETQNTQSIKRARCFSANMVNDTWPTANSSLSELLLSDEFQQQLFPLLALKITAHSLDEVMQHHLESPN